MCRSRQHSRRECATSRERPDGAPVSRRGAPTMSVKDQIVIQGKRMLLSPSVMRWVSDDRVMKAAEGVMDARSRFKAAWRVLLNGHDLPHVDPALDDHIAPTETNGHKLNGNGLSGHANGSKANGHAPSAIKEGSSDMHTSLKERSSLAGIGGRDVFDKCFKFMAADNAR